MPSHNTENLRYERLRNAYLQKLAVPQLENPQPVQTAAPQPSSAPALINPSQPQQALAVDRFGVRAALEAGGAAIGGAIGAGTGAAAGGVGSVPGMLLGGALGTAAGRGLGNLVAEIEKQARAGRLADSIGDELESIMAGEDKFIKNVARQGLDMAQAATTDLAFGTGIHTIGRFASGTFRFAGRITGAQSTEVREIITAAREGNLAIGAIDLDKPFFTASGKVAGVIPIIGGPIRRQAQGKAIRASREFVRTMDEISPAIDLPAMGVTFTESGKATLSARRTIANGQYERMRKALDLVGQELKLAGESDAIVPTEPIRKRATKLLGETGNLPITEQGSQIGFPVSSDDNFLAALRNFAELPENITPQALEALQKNLNRAARSRSGNQMAANEFRIITELNSATWDALEKIKLDVPRGEFVNAAIRKAKGSWVNLKSLEETAAAAKFKRVDGNFFGTGFRIGRAEIDEIADMFVSSPSTMRSPEFIDGLEKLVGKDNRKALARAILERAANPTGGLARATVDPVRGTVRGGTTDIVVFDAARMRKNLGLTGPEQLGAGVMRKNKAALSRLLEGTGVSAERLDSFLRTVERVQGAPSGDPSTFLQRRVILGGGLGIGALGATAASQVMGPIGFGAFLLGGNKFSKLISSPGGLALLRDGMKPNLTRQQMLNLARRLSAFFPNEEAEIQEGPLQ